MSCGKPGCDCPSYRDHLLSVNIGAAALPTRNAEVANTTQREVVLAQDMDAYQRLRRNKVQPRSIDGSAHLERHASNTAEIERGLLGVKEVADV